MYTYKTTCVEGVIPTASALSECREKDLQRRGKINIPQASAKVSESGIMCGRSRECLEATASTSILLALGSLLVRYSSWGLRATFGMNQDTSIGRVEFSGRTAYSDGLKTRSEGERDMELSLRAR